jgi:hypothetical protein
MVGRCQRELFDADVRVMTARSSGKRSDCRAATATAGSRATFPYTANLSLWYHASSRRSPCEKRICHAQISNVAT